MAAITTFLRLDGAGFQRGINAAKSAVSGFAGGVGKVAGIVGGLVGAIGVPVTFGAAIAGAKDALDFGSALVDLRERTAAPIKDLVVLQQAFKNAGMDADAVGPAINKMQMALAGMNEEGEATSPAFERMGLSMKELQGLNPAEQFQRVGAAIAGIGDANERVKAVRQLFGRSGSQFLSLFRDANAISVAAKQVGSQAGILETSANAFDTASDTINSAGVKLRGFFVGLMSEALPSLQGALQAFDGLDLAPIGQRLGASFTNAIDILRGGIAQGNMMEILGVGLELAFSKGIDFLGAGILGAMDVLKAELTNISFWSLVGTLFKGAMKLTPGGIISEAALAVGKQAAGITTGETDPAKLFAARFAAAESDKSKTLAKRFDELTDAAHATGEALRTATPLMSDFFSYPIGEGGTVAGGPMIPMEEFIGPMTPPGWEKAVAGEKKDVAETATSLKSAATNVDQFARIGLFAGGGPSSGIADHIRSTAENMKLFIKHVQAGNKVTIESMPPIVV